MATRDEIPLLRVDSSKTPESTVNKNAPPFDREHTIFSSDSSVDSTKPRVDLPAVYTARSPRGAQVILKSVNLEDTNSVSNYFTHHLSVSRLNAVHKHLWIAGLPRHAQPLHQHILRKRSIVITDRADCHLLWRNDDLLLMPLPPYLLDHDMWTTHLCADASLFELANGMLLSYIWLICSESDFRIAHENNLLPREVDWRAWTTLIRSTATRLPYNATKDVNPRYLYGELRLGRINWIYRFCSRTRNFTTLLRGYSYGYTTYGSFFQRNTAWIVVSTIYITVVLTAMQVGLGTKELQDNTGFSRASYGLTILAIVAPIGGLVLVFCLMLVLVPFNLSYALKQRRKAAVPDTIAARMNHL